jgi:RNA polymerase sigma-70 factor (ECF subfamily)
MNLSQDQFQRLALAELDALYRMARRFTQDHNRAEDLVQETFARALASRSGFDLHSFGMKPWLLRIMYNLHLNHAAREKRFPNPLPEEVLDSKSSFRQQGHLPLETNSFEAMDEQVVRALDQLPEEYRVIMLLWAVEEFSYKEIAAALEIPIGTVMSRLHRARRRLSDQLQPFAQREGIVRE